MVMPKGKIQHALLIVRLETRTYVMYINASKFSKKKGRNGDAYINGEMEKGYTDRQSNNFCQSKSPDLYYF